MNQYVRREVFDRSGLIASPIATAFGRRVFLRRIDLGLSQAAMIQRLNSLTGGHLGRSTASVWENGHAEPSMSTVNALAIVLETRPEYLAYGVKLSAPVLPPERKLLRHEPKVLRAKLRERA